MTDLPAIIRSMVSADVPLVVAIESRVTPFPWRQRQFEESIERHRCLSALHGNQLVGYVVYQVVAGDAEVLNIGVHPECQGQGVGRLLFEAVVEQIEGSADRLFLEVRASNVPAIGLYESVGMVEICRRTNYYRSGSESEDALVMALEFADDLFS